MTNVDILSLLEDKLKDFTLHSDFEQRSVGDKIENICKSIVKEQYPNKYKKAKSKRSIEDFSLIGNDFIQYFDVKTHFIQERGFSMPNLISIDRLRKTLSDVNKSLSYIFISYHRVDGEIKVSNIHIKYVWELDWSILRIGALGKGQLQIRNANNDFVFTDIGRDRWFDVLKKEAPKFYINEIQKIENYIHNWS